jgi:Amt family ammonium transporter
VLVGIPIFTVPGAGVSLTVQLIGVALIAGWTIAATAVVFGVLKALGQIRVSAAHEVEGLDMSEHGVDTYPEFGRPETATDGGQPLAQTDGGIEEVR